MLWQSGHRHPRIVTSGSIPEGGSAQTKTEFGPDSSTHFRCAPLSKVTPPREPAPPHAGMGVSLGSLKQLPGQPRAFQISCCKYFTVTLLEQHPTTQQQMLPKPHISLQEPGERGG